MSDDNDTLDTSDGVNNEVKQVLDPKQVEAINACCDITNRVVTISGSAGTGKTTILTQVYYALKDAGYSVALCSPTGKAAKRIYEVTGIQASTIHRLLEYTHPGDIDPKTGKPEGFAYPKRDKQNPLDYDVILADEYAMVNKQIHRELLDALKAGSVIRFFGDERQLAPIEEDDWKNKADKKQPEPSPFIKNLCELRLKSVKLTTVFRQKEGSGLLDNLHLILRGSMPKNNDQWYNKFTEYPVKVLEEYVLEHLDDIPFNSVENQIIVPGNTKFVGTVKLNFILQAIYFDPSEDIEYNEETGEKGNHIIIPRHNWDIGMYNTKGEAGGFIKLHVGDKVIYKANNLDLGVFNGETGIVKEFDNDIGEVVIDFGDREQAFPIMMLKTNKYGKMVEYDPRKDIDLAYAITTHKSQGSQYKHVVYILNKCDTWLINNRNFYTGCSRAQQYVYVITDQQSFTRAVHTKD